MDKLFKVFVSSTFRDLKDERKSIRKCIDNINLQSIGMESFVPSEKTSHETSLKELHGSDIYLLLIGDKYGSRIEDCKIDCGLKCKKDISYTNCEFRIAKEKNIPPICFSFSEIGEEEGKREIQAFKEEVRKEVYLKPIKKEHLKEEVERALRENIKRWVGEGKLRPPEFYGREEEIKELLDTKENTVFVKGIGGIGKTTLVEGFLLIKKIEGFNILEIVKERDYNRTDIGYRLGRSFLERKEYIMLDLIGLAEILDIPYGRDYKIIMQQIVDVIEDKKLILFIDDAHEIIDERVLALIGKATNSLSNGRIILAGRKDITLNVGKTVKINKGIDNHGFIKSVFKENGKEEQWDKELSKKIIEVTSAHPLAVKLLVRNLDYLNDIEQFSNILNNPYDEVQAKEFIGRVVREVCVGVFERTTFLSVYRMPFPLSIEVAKNLIARMIVKKVNGRFFFTHDLIQEILYASLVDKKKAHKTASKYYEKFEGTTNYRGIAEYLYHLVKSREENAYIKCLKYIDILIKQGFYREIISIIQELLVALDEIDNKKEKVGCYMTLGVAYERLGDFMKAFQLYEIALKIAQEVEDRLAEAKCYGNLASFYDRVGHFEKAIEFHEQSMKIFKEIEDRWGEAKCYMNLGITYDRLGDYSKAIEFHKKSISIRKDIRDREGLGVCYLNLGIVYYEKGAFNEAIEFYKKSLKIAQEARDKFGEGKCYGNLGLAYYKLSNFEKAIEFHKKSLKIYKNMSCKLEEAICYMNLANIYAEQHKTKKAIKFYKKSLKISQDIGVIEGEARCFYNLGEIYCVLGDHSKAIDFYEKSAEIFSKIGQLINLKEVYESMAETYRNINKLPEAEKYKKEAEKLTERIMQLGLES